MDLERDRLQGLRLKCCWLDLSRAHDRALPLLQIGCMIRGALAATYLVDQLSSQRGGTALLNHKIIVRNTGLTSTGGRTDVGGG